MLVYVIGQILIVSNSLVFYRIQPYLDNDRYFLCNGVILFYKENRGGRCGPVV